MYKRFRKGSSLSFQFIRETITATGAGKIKIKRSSNRFRILKFSSAALFTVRREEGRRGRGNEKKKKKIAPTFLINFRKKKERRKKKNVTH